MANPLIIDEGILDAALAYFAERLPEEITNTNLGLDPHLQIEYPRYIYDDMVDPEMMTGFPAMAMWVEESEDAQRDRAMREATANLRVLYVFQGPMRQGYKFAAALTSITLRDYTYGCRIGRATVTERKYYSASNPEADELRAAEVVIEIKQEVKRT
jgi:hypothetical protein